MTATKERGLRVGELAAEAGIASDTVRYYERAGLLPPPGLDTATGYRAYERGAVDRLLFIQGAQRLGLRLRDIRDLLAVRDTGTCPCEPAGDTAAPVMDELDAEMRRLAELRGELVRMLEGLPSANCPDPEPGSWCPPEGR